MNRKQAVILHCFFLILSLHVSSFVLKYPVAVPTTTTTRVATSLTSKDAFRSSASPINPLLLNALTSNQTTVLNLGGSLSVVSTGLACWRSSLLRGQVPQETAWPPEPLFTALCQIMMEHDMPRLVQRHPELISPVLLTLIRLTKQYSLGAGHGVTEEDDLMEDEPLMNDDTDPHSHPFPFDGEKSIPDLFEFSQKIASEMIDEFGATLRGLGLVDSLFGRHHTIDANHPSLATAETGSQDGIWHHSGWKVIPHLQSQVQSMQELQELVRELGQRPTSVGPNRHYRRFQPRRQHPDGALGAEFNPLAPESVNGLTWTGSFSRMLPAEAVLLKACPTLRRLFLAKMAESKLLSYEIASWSDVPSVPKSGWRHRMPAAPGGPIIVCLDTSWSMSTSRREELSKAVVLACVSTASRQQRPCQVISFSTESGTMESGLLTPDVDGISRLLDFLSHSFGGGTDVTGALKFAMQTAERATGLDVSLNNTSLGMIGADLLLVTDGEIPDPPVSDDLMEQISHLKLHSDLKIHGLLVGRNESQPLERIATSVHTFLLDYDDLPGVSVEEYASFGKSQPPYKRGVSVHRKIRGPRLTSSALGARKFDDFEEYEYERKISRKRQKKVREAAYTRSSNIEDEIDARSSVSSREGFDEQVPERSVTYLDQVNQAVNHLREQARARLAEGRWDPHLLDKEIRIDQESRSAILEAAKAVSSGLIEREEEALLVVLALIAQEHIFLIGVPGTGKSLLGRRLAELSGGEFFQRLLTRFTTPDEIFGPLSLRSLENDVYMRCTDGFLPTASVAFLDEIFKANSAILNSLLSILNERKFDNGKGRPDDCLVQCVVGASNELPENDELDALFDRFLLRKEVLPVSDDGLTLLLSANDPGCDAQSCELSICEDLTQAVSRVSKSIEKIAVDEDIISIFRDLRSFLREDLGVDIGDRRMVKAVRLLRVSAASNDRTKVDAVDCMLLQHLFWEEPGQRVAIFDWLLDHISPIDLSTIKSFQTVTISLWNEAKSIVRKTGGSLTGIRQQDSDVVEALAEEVERVISLLEQKRAAMDRHATLVERASEHLWLDENQVLSLKQILLPRIRTLSEALERCLADAIALKLSFSQDISFLEDDIRLPVIEELSSEHEAFDVEFTSEEMALSMKEAKRKFDPDVLRVWKRARKRLEK